MNEARKLKKLEQKRMRRIAKYEIANRLLLKKYEIACNRNKVLKLNGLVSYMVKNGVGLGESNLFANSYLEKGRDYVNRSYRLFRQINGITTEHKHSYIKLLDEFLEKIGHAIRD